MLKVISRRNFTPLCGLVLFLSVFSVFVGIGGSVYADTSMNYNINIKPALKLSVSSGTVSLLLNPTTQNFAAQNLNVTVGTNNYYGYQLFMNTASNTTDLVRQNNSAVDGASFSTPPTIPTLASSTTASAFPANYWGYRINNNVGGNADYIDTTASNANSGNYFGYTSGTLISSSATTTNEKTASLTFGAKADFNKPAGTYKLDLNFEAVPIVRTYYMQELAENVPLSDMLCTSEPITVLDQRDEKAYSITRLPDGNCWMTTNLDLAGGTTLTPANSNVSANYTLPASETISSGTTLADSWAFTDSNTAYVFNTNSTTCGADSPCYSYYNYAAATAGTNPYLYPGEATSDICPKGWKLPTNAEYTALSNIYTTSAALTAAPFNAVYAGSYSGNEFYNNDSAYWSSTNYSSNAYFLYFNTSSTYPFRNARGNGLSVRCVLKKPTMQDFGIADATNMATGNTKTLTDARDGKDYTIAKLPDGNVWMTKNLDLAGGTTVTPADSNVSANYTLPASETISSGTTLTNSSAFNNADTAYVFNSGSTTCGENSPCYSYYSYAAATAGTNPSSGLDNATSDICPKGWRLPTNAEFDTLVSTYPNNAAITTPPFNAIYAGEYGGYNNSVTFWYGGIVGRYWSSLAYDSSANALAVDSFGAEAGTAGFGKNYGFSIRCIFGSRTLSSLYHMQDVTPAIVENTPDGATTILRDARDYNPYNMDYRTYTVAKINGRLWMTENLDLPGGTTLTPADSNVSANYKLPSSSTSGFNNADEAYVYNSNGTTCGGDDPCYSYYSYVTATAGTNPSSGNTASDICPKGWRLPTEAEFTTLANTYTTGAAISAAPFNNVYAGFYGNGEFGYGSSRGFYWSSTAYDSSRAYAFGSLHPTTFDSHKAWGFTIRCVSK